MLMDRRAFTRCLVAGALLGVMAHSQVAHAGRYVKFEIFIDDKLVFKTHEEDEGKESADVVWGYLNYLDLETAKGYKVAVDKKDPRRATIKGKIAIKSRYGGTVEVEELKLFRSRETDPWRIDRKEVQRTMTLRTSP